LYEVYDDFRDRNNSVQLSLVWSEALEQVSKTSGVAESLRDRRNNIITEIQTNPNQWVETYLPLLRSFIQQVDRLSKQDPNYAEIGVVLGESSLGGAGNGNDNRSATTGVLKRLSNYLAKVAQEAQDNPTNHTKTLQAQKSVNKEPDSIDVDIVEPNPKL
jgi:hypothetical protein